MSLLGTILGIVAVGVRVCTLVTRGFLIFLGGRCGLEAVDHVTVSPISFSSRTVDPRLRTLRGTVSLGIFRVVRGEVGGVRTFRVGLSTVEETLGGQPVSG